MVKKMLIVIAGVSLITVNAQGVLASNYYQKSTMNYVEYKDSSSKYETWNSNKGEQSWAKVTVSNNGYNKNSSPSTAYATKGRPSGSHSHSHERGLGSGF